MGEVIALAPRRTDNRQITPMECLDWAKELLASDWKDRESIIVISVTEDEGGFSTTWLSSRLRMPDLIIIGQALIANGMENVS